MAMLSFTASLFPQHPRIPSRISALPSAPLFSLRDSARPRLLRMVYALDGGDAPSGGPNSGASAGRSVDEWGERAAVGEDAAESTRAPGADPPGNEDEWGGSDAGNGTFDPTLDLKQSLVDTVYGTEFGLKSSAEVRAEVVELVNRLEAANPIPAPVESPELNGNWILVYTAFSELLPLIAVGSTSLLKLKSISQSIDTDNMKVLNTATYASAFTTISFSASASFEVRSPSRIQVKFEEGIFPPPEISPTLEVPSNLDLFGQKVDLTLLQQSLNPIQEAISRAISGQPPLKVPIPGERSQSWLVTTYLDKDLRISRGDGGLFVLVKECSPLLSQQES